VTLCFRVVRAFGPNISGEFHKIYNFGASGDSRFWGHKVKVRLNMSKWQRHTHRRLPVAYF